MEYVMIKDFWAKAESTINELAKLGWRVHSFQRSGESSVIVLMEMEDNA